MKRWSTRQVARQAGVSPATVSRVLNHQPGVSPELTHRVHQAIRRLEQEGSGSGNGAGARGGRKVGVAFPRRIETYDPEPMGGAFYGQVLTGIDEVLRAEGHEITLFPYDPADSAAALVGQQQDRYDALILMGADTPDPLAREASDRGIPVIVVDKRVRGVDSVVSDNVGGAEEVTAHVLAAGYRSLVYLCETCADPSFAARREGFERAVAASGLPVQTRFYEVGRGWLRAPEVMRELHESGDFPMAVVAGNDMTALQVLALAQARGIQVPAEMGVAGFDDVALSRHSYPPLTTVRVDKAEMGRLAARRLLDRMATPDLLPVTITMHVAVVVRESTALPS